MTQLKHIFVYFGLSCPAHTSKHARVDVILIMKFGHVLYVASGYILGHHRNHSTIYSSLYSKLVFNELFNGLTNFHSFFGSLHLLDYPTPEIVFSYTR